MFYLNMINESLIIDFQITPVIVADAAVVCVMSVLYPFWGTHVWKTEGNKPKHY